MSEEFTMTGGLRINLFNASWPFAKLTASKEMILLKAFSKEYAIERNKIEAIKKHKGIFSTGLKIEHNMAGIPSEPIFWTFDFPKLKLVLEQLGYEVED